MCTISVFYTVRTDRDDEQTIPSTSLSGRVRLPGPRMGRGHGGGLRSTRAEGRTTFRTRRLGFRAQNVTTPKVQVLSDPLERGGSLSFVGTRVSTDTPPKVISFGPFDTSWANKSLRKLTSWDKSVFGITAGCLVYERSWMLRSILS